MSGRAKPDPRRPEAIVPFHLPKKSDDEPSGDLSGTIAMAVAMMSMVLRNKWVAWGALDFGVMAVLNTKNTSEGLTGWSSLMMGAMAVVMQYVNEALVAQRGQSG